MGDSACVMHGFSHAAVLPHESQQMNPMHALGDSISFGRFMTESLSWEKWSTFSSHKKYVEEAERYARPGLVAQKKAFFEAHYKRIAAKKAEALLEQENAAKTEVEAAGDDNNDCEEQRVFLNSNSDVVVKMEEVKREDDVEIGKEEIPVKRNSVNEVNNLENQDTVSASENSGSLQIERPSLKISDDSEEIPSATSKKRSDLSSMDALIQQKTWEFPPSPVKQENNVNQSTRKSGLDSTGQRRPSSNSLHALLNLVPLKEPDKEPIIMVSTKKLEEKFNANEVQKTQLKKTLKEKAGNKLRKLSCVFCFKARPSPEFHEERETTKNQVKKTPAAQTQLAVLGTSISAKKQQGTISMPPPPPPRSLADKSAYKNSSKKSVPRKSLTNSLPERITHENASPNILQ